MRLPDLLEGETIFHGYQHLGSLPCEVRTVLYLAEIDYSVD